MSLIILNDAMKCRQYITISFRHVIGSLIPLVSQSEIPQQVLNMTFRRIMMTVTWYFASLPPSWPTVPPLLFPQKNAKRRTMAK
jgi:hypothetical protein